MTPDMDTAGREILANIPASQQTLFFLLAWLSMAVFSVGIGVRGRLWLRGRLWPLLPGGSPVAHFWGFVVNTLVQPRMRAAATGRAHMAIFWGFLVLFVGTNLVALEHDTPLSFLHGAFYLVFSLAMDLCGLVLIAGVWVASVRRYRARGDADRVRGYGPALAQLALLGVTGFAVEGLRISLLGSYWFDWSPVGAVVAVGFDMLALDDAALGRWHRFAWWLHAVSALVFIAYLPFGRLLHTVTAPLQTLVADQKGSGALSTPFRLEDIESGTRTRATPRVLADLHWTQLLSADACTECGLCDDSCPALAVGRPLSPRRTMVELRRSLDRGARSLDRTPLADAVSAAAAWSCTTCGACAQACPVSIQPADILIDARRALVLDNRVEPGMDTALNNLRETGNPFGLDPGRRMAWAADLPADSMPTVLESGENGGLATPEVLLWVGCWGAFDERGQEVTRALAKLLARAGVDYAVLGAEERCTGDPARRLGEEGLFQQIAAANIDTLRGHGVTRIVTACPHCMNSLGNEYREFGADFQVVHHGRFIEELLAQGRLRVDTDIARTDDERVVTFHDPCYLGRHNGGYDAPRQLLSVLPATSVTEMASSRQDSKCCGAGGGNAWFDLGLGGNMGAARYSEAMETGADLIATGCPFCLAMFDEAASGTGKAESPRARDVAELVEEVAVAGVAAEASAFGKAAGGAGKRA